MKNSKRKARRVRLSKQEVELLENGDSNLERNNRIEAIRSVRARTGLGLYDAVRLVDGFKNEGQMSITETRLITYR